MKSSVLSIAWIVLWSLACSGGSAPSSSQTSGSSSTPVISSSQALQIIKGCCNGAGGTYSPAGNDCVIYDNQSAFAGCVGTLKVRFDGPGQSGQVRTIYGSDLYRP